MQNLGDVTQGKISFLSISPDLLDMMAEAGQIEVRPRPAGNFPSAELLLREKLEKWVSGHWAILPGGEVILPLLRSLKAQAVYLPLTVAEIGVDETGEVHSLQTNVEWRWEGFFYAFTVFWAFIYHTPNEHLHDRETIWLRILEHNAEENFGSPLAIRLALYERLVAIRFWDIDHQERHYITNIVARPGLTPEELRERPVFFRQLIDYLLAKVVEELRTLAKPKEQ